MTEADRLFEAAARALHGGDHAGARDLFRRAGEAAWLDAEVIEAMDLTPEGDPRAVPEGERLPATPELILFRGLFSPGECRYLAEAAWPMLQPSVVIDNATGRQVRDPVRTSDGVGFTWPLENPAVHALNRRIAAASDTAPEQGGPLQVLRYRPGDQYRTHYDAIPGFTNQGADDDCLAERRL